MSDEHTTPALALAHGRTLALSPERLRIADRSGALELEIDLRAEGPVVRVRAAALELAAEGEVSLSCERFELHAREQLRLVSDGDLQTSVAGDLDCRAAGLAHWEGRDVRVRARRGEARLEAHDDVRVDGERVLLNS
jgi:hypothetical protein